MIDFVFKFLAVRAAGGLVAMLVLLAPSHDGAAGAELQKLSVAHRFAQDHPVHQGLERFREDLTGVVSVEINTPRSEHESMQGLVAGTVGAAVLSSAALQQAVSELALLDLIGLWWNRTHWVRALDGEAGRELAVFLQRPSQAAGAGFHVLGFWGGTRRHLLTRRGGVPKLENLSGLRLQIPLNPIRSKMWKAVGVQPVLPIQPDLAATLRGGTVEGIEEEADAIFHGRLFEVASHLTETGHVIATRPFVITKPAWQRLTPAQQAAVSAAAQKAAVVARAGEQNHEAEVLAALKERGVQLYSFTGQDAFVARTRSFRIRYADELGISRLFTLIEKAAKP